MAKIYGINGVITGKTGAAVYVVRNGEQIMRQYQPIVANPSTPAQVASRAKMKLMSQLSAVFASIIAIPRMGSVSSRNLFVKKNYKLTSYASDTASIDLNAVQITKSVVGLPAISATRADGKNVVSLDPNTGVNVSRIIYAMFVKQADGTLRFVDSIVVTNAGNNNRYGAEFAEENRECVYYAYGVRDNTEAARVAFGDLQVISAETVAKLITSRTLLESDVTLTETKAFTLAAVSV